MTENWPDRLDDVPPSKRADLILADPHRYMTQARAEAKEWAREYVRTCLDHRAAARKAELRALPWWNWRRWWV